MNTLFLKELRWSIQTFLLILMFVFIIVPILIENWAHDLLQQWFQNDLYAGTLTGLIMAIVFTVALYYITIKPYGLNWQSLGLRPFAKSYWLPIIGWTIFLIVGSVLLVILMDLFSVGVENKKTASLTAELNGLTILIAFISAAIVSPIYEEILYRGFIYRWLRAKCNIGLSMLISSTIFTVVHLPTYNTLPVNFFSGLIFAWTYEKTGSIYPAMIIHSIFNGLAILLTAFA
ncbi:MULTISPECIES: CPBP family intramembrane glutamic endopeptidase [Cytobacillus]|uniref:CPBP family intramembrane metalloprotease n=1 Tax=Cytobacillus stercorigallinarum TaxID=2762240 RepID=A0ABR8QQA4_9BACI|nr:type II CAAX endopeptidase family protein [Cytobacillus stercorigallinarum]MBD7937462.1 CPBP family intramembrane metalloprotease [Cytobacillus stercorigallinarum]